ncbi:MAG: FAD-dependent oxidoreductase [Bacteroidales bacterium]|jgi:hypothetical protein|nr:FAD-dependent oxidoreductase [Bacteroidales bacterium]
MNTQIYNYDAVIIGGGTAGVAAAYALKDSGKRILLVESRERLGGTAVLAYVFDWIAGVFPEYLGEVFTCLKQKGKAKGDLEHSWLPCCFRKDGYNDALGNSIQMVPFDLSEKYCVDLENTGNNTVLDIWLNHCFMDIECWDKGTGTVSQIKVRDKSGFDKIVSASYFIDSSADAVLCRAKESVKGIDYFIGRDRKSLYNESIAVDNPDPNQLNEPALFYQLADNADDTAILNEVKTVKYDAATKKVIKPDYITWDGYTFAFIDNGEGKAYWCNPMMALGISGIDVINRGSDAIYEEAETRILEHWKYAKLSLKLAHDNGADDNSKWGINWYVWQRNLSYNYRAPMPGIRESYRAACEYMLTQNDLARMYTAVENAVAIGTHPVDMHNGKSLDNNEMTRFNSRDLRPYGIPYQCLLPKRFSNVLAACRAFGASQIAASSARTNKLVAQLGWAAGNAVKYCMDNGGRLKDLSGKELQDEKYINYQYYTGHIKDILKDF